MILRHKIGKTSILIKLTGARACIFQYNVSSCLCDLFASSFCVLSISSCLRLYTSQLRSCLEFFIKICIFQIIILTLPRKYKNKQLRRIKHLNKISYETHSIVIICSHVCPRYMGV